MAAWRIDAPVFPVVIAASTSPFDKFPAPPRRLAKAQKNYRYVGMRGEGMYGASSAVSLLSSAARGLLSKLSETPPSLNLLEVLDSLKFSPVFNFVLKPQFERSRENETSSRYRGDRSSFTSGAYRYSFDTRVASILEATDSLQAVLRTSTSPLPLWMRLARCASQLISEVASRLLAAR